MSDGWHYIKDGKRHGPVAAAELGRLVRDGALPHVVFVSPDGEKDWSAADTVGELIPHLGQAPVAAAARPAASKGAVLLDDDLAGFSTTPAAATAEPEASAAAAPAAPVAVPTESAPRSLADSDFPSLVYELGQTDWTGVMTFTRGIETKSVVAQEGRLVFASSSSRDDWLGKLLLRRGRISLRQYVDAGRAMGQGKRFGAILVELGALKAEDLVKVVIEHTQEIIYGLFQWTEGLVRLRRGLEGSEAITLKMSTPDIILQGIGRIESWGRVERGLGGVETRYLRVAEWQTFLKEMTLPPVKAELLDALAEPKDALALCAASSLPDFETCRTLWAFRVIGIVRPVKT
jgi:hypothetical protein